jgi:hypothetical protein
MKEIIEAHKILIAELNNLYPTFIAKYDGNEPLTPTIDFMNSTKAYCVLCHAVFEEFFEKIATATIERVERDFLYKKEVTITSLSLFAHYCTRVSIEDDERKPEVRIFDLIRSEFELIKRQYSHDIYENHGISKKYLRKLFQPLGIDIVSNIGTSDVLNSLQLLARYRGQFAHKFSATKVPSVQEINEIITDTILLSEHIAFQIIKRHPYTA